ncbi:UNVERIFIED_CONTAM: hypothetical protein FKN15_008721 [Acipenser sinensis]
MLGTYRLFTAKKSQKMSNVGSTLPAISSFSRNFTQALAVGLLRSELELR